jgi:hypothetical protein
MVATIPYNPYGQMSGNAGLFNATSTGLRQGTAYADPSTRYRLRAGILSNNETLPMWGGVGVYANVPGGSMINPGGAPSYTLGPLVGRATGLTGSLKLVGFSVFDEAYAMVTTPQSPVPLAASGMHVNWYPLGSLARIAVACDPSLVSLRGSSVLPQVSWDFTNQMLVPFLGAQTISSGTYNNTTGLVSLTMAAPQTFDAGDSITLASLTGTGAFASLNGTFTSTLVNGTNVQFLAPAGLGASAITGGSLTVGGAASAALAVEVLDVQSANCETVSYNPIGEQATWNYNGACAVIALNPNG